MIFKDRHNAGQKLGERLAQKNITQDPKKTIVASLVRGGTPVGYEVAKKLKVLHIPLVVKKIGAPYQEELAIGAACDGHVFLNHKLIDRGEYTMEDIQIQIEKAKKKEHDYLAQFGVKKINVKGKTVIVVDDGVATGASVLASCLCLKSKGARQVILAVPVAPFDFDPSDTSLFDSTNTCFDEVVILHKAPNFHAVGQYYEKFDQLTDGEALSYFKK